ncbi:hypothetical protein, partial [Mycobacterium tuberculosis]|uniref:hypothetical protein n=1 Tax=Mycobacterium tuberculosis TaxID=1773 RepID=UPI0021F33025
MGVSTAEPVRTAVATMSRSGDCQKGFLSRTRVDIQSNNEFYDDFCLYAGGSLEIQSNGYFEDGVRVMVPPGSYPTYKNHNVGIERAIVQGSMSLPEVDQLARIIDSLRYSASTSPFVPSYITNRSPQTLSASNLTSAQLAPGQIYIANNCPLNISGTVSQVVLITDCKV